MGPSTSPLVVCDNVVKIYEIEGRELVALQGLDLEVAPGEIVAIAGASGSGKTTLLNILGGLDDFDAGQCVVAGWDLARMRNSHRIRYRRSVVGYLWQQSGRNLLGHLPIRANVEVPMRLQGVGSRKSRRRAAELLAAVGLEAMGRKYPYQLSGGEQQRAALAVALANQPPLLLADEPTGELDTQTAGEIFQLLQHVKRQLGTTILIVTHDLTLAERADRMLSIRDGRVSSESALDVLATSTTSYRESVVIDRVGRLQLPHGALERIPFRGRADVHFDDDHVEVWPISARYARKGRLGQSSTRESEGEW